MQITISNKLTIANAPDYLAGVIQDRLTFANPKFLENEKMGRWNGETPEFLKFYELVDNGDIIVPCGCNQTDQIRL